MIDQGLIDRKDKPAYVRFETRAIENKQESVRQGRYVGRDVDFAGLTPPYSKDLFWIEVESWLENMNMDVQHGRMPQAWADDYRKAYHAWKQGHELPVKGTPIKGWPVISPAQTEALIRMNVLTVEDLAGINDEGIRRIGMGGVDLKHKAVAWLQQAQDKGPLTQEIASVKAENAAQKACIENLTRQVEELRRLIPQASAAMPMSPESSDIAASDIIDEPVPVRKGKR